MAADTNCSGALAEWRTSHRQHYSSRRAGKGREERRTVPLLSHMQHIQLVAACKHYVGLLQAEVDELRADIASAKAAVQKLRVSMQQGAMPY
jgi:hypothetical protein